MKNCTKCLLDKQVNEFDIYKKTGKSRSKCKKCARDEDNERYIKNKTQILDRQKENRDPIKHKNACKKWYINNKDKIKCYNKEWMQNKRKSDINYRIKNNLRSRLSGALKKNKVGSAIKDLGCSMEFFRKHLEQQWTEGMSWSNYGKKPGQWSTDHIIALSNVDLSNRDEFLKVVHYTNLRPMWHCGVGGNISKGNRS